MGVLVVVALVGCVIGAATYTIKHQSTPCAIGLFVAYACLQLWVGAHNGTLVLAGTLVLFPVVVFIITWIICRRRWR